MIDYQKNYRYADNDRDQEFGAKLQPVLVMDVLLLDENQRPRRVV